MKQPLHSPSSASTAAPRGTSRGLAGLAVCVAFSGILVAAFAVGATGSPAPSSGAMPQVNLNRTDAPMRSGFSQLVKTVRPAVVNITTSSVRHAGAAEAPSHGQPGWFGQEPQGRNFFGMPPFPAPRQGPRAMGMGSGSS